MNPLPVTVTLTAAELSHYLTLSLQRDGHIGKDWNAITIQFFVADDGHNFAVRLIVSREERADDEHN